MATIVLIAGLGPDGVSRELLAVANGDGTYSLGVSDGEVLAALASLQVTEVTALGLILAKLLTAPATEGKQDTGNASLAAILAKQPTSPSLETGHLVTIDSGVSAVLAKIIAAPATEAKQNTEITALGLLATQATLAALLTRANLLGTEATLADLEVVNVNVTMNVQLTAMTAGADLDVSPALAFSLILEITGTFMATLSIVGGNAASPLIDITKSFVDLSTGNGSTQTQNSPALLMWAQGAPPPIIAVYTKTYGSGTPVVRARYRRQIAS